MIYYKYLVYIIIIHGTVMTPWVLFYLYYRKHYRTLTGIMTVIIAAAVC